MTHKREPATLADVTMVGIGILMVGEIGPAVDWPIWYVLIPQLTELAIVVLGITVPVFWTWLKDPRP